MYICIHVCMYMHIIIITVVVVVVVEVVTIIQLLSGYSHVTMNNNNYITGPHNYCYRY